MAHEKQFLQHLPALDLSIERYTSNVPHDGFWYVRQSGQIIDRRRTQKAARAAYDDVIAKSGWTPQKTEMTPEEMLLRESQMRDDERFHDYWNSSHKFRARGGVHKNRR